MKDLKPAMLSNSCNWTSSLMKAGRKLGTSMGTGIKLVLLFVSSVN